jgi:hypothetical protein
LDSVEGGQTEGNEFVSIRLNSSGVPGEGIQIGSFKFVARFVERVLAVLSAYGSRGGRDQSGGGNHCDENQGQQKIMHGDLFRSQIAACPRQLHREVTSPSAFGLFSNVTLHVFWKKVQKKRELSETFALIP